MVMFIESIFVVMDLIEGVIAELVGAEDGVVGPVFDGFAASRDEESL